MRSLSVTEVQKNIFALFSMACAVFSMLRERPGWELDERMSILESNNLTRWLKNGKPVGYRLGSQRLSGRKRKTGGLSRASYSK